MLCCAVVCCAVLTFSLPLSQFLSNLDFQRLASLRREMNSPPTAMHSVSSRLLHTGRLYLPFDLRSCRRQRVAVQSEDAMETLRWRESSVCLTDLFPVLQSLPSFFLCQLCRALHTSLLPPLVETSDELPSEQSRQRKKGGRMSC